jgi:uncharacterized protein (TIGR03083 family)
MATLDHETWMALATEEYRRLLVLLRDLPAEDWSRPTACEGWDVADLVAHLCGAAESTARLREAARQAIVGVRRHRAGMLVDSMNAVQVAERRGRTPAELIEELGDAGRRGIRARARLPRPVRAVVVPFGPPLGTRPLGYLMDRIYTRDAWTHRIDLADATGTAVDLTADHDGLLVADLVDEWAELHTGDFALELTGTAGLTRARDTAGPAGQEIRMDAIEFVRALAGRAARPGLLAVDVPF